MATESTSQQQVATDADRLAWVATTLLLEGRNDVSPTWIHHLARGLVLYGCTPVRVRGVLYDAPVPGLRSDVKIRSTAPAFRRAGITPAGLAHELREARMRHDVLPCIRRDWAESAIDPVVWPAITAVARDGPVVARARLERAIGIESTREVRPTRARPQGGTVSRRYLDGCVRAMVRLFRVLVALRASQADLPFVEQWVELPGRVAVSGAEANTDRSGPPRTSLRLVHAHLNREVATRLSIEPGQDEMEAISRMSRSALEHKAVFKALRNRAIFDLVAVTGMRGGALVKLRRCDFDRQHRCFDGELRPALAVRPAKTLASTLVRWKVLPLPLADQLTATTAVLARVNSDPLDPNGALFPGQPSRPDTHMMRESLTHLFAGEPPSRFRDVGRAGLVPFNVAALDGTDGLGPDDYLGYSPQRVRHSTLQMTRDGAAVYMREHGLDMDPECLSEVLLDHEVRSDRYGYADVSDERGRERWTAVAIEVNWQMLTGDMGARKAPDAGGFRAAVRERNAVAAEIDLLQQRVDSAFAAMERTARVTRRGDDAMTQILNLLRAQAGVSWELQLERRLEARRRELDIELERIRHDPNRLVLLPDDAPPEDQRVDLDRIEREEANAGGGMFVSLGDKPAVREWITVNELAELASVSPASARRWASGQLLPFPAGDPRNPWLTAVPPVDQGTHARRRRIAAARLSPEFLAPQARKQLLEQQLAGWPVGWSIEECERPLQLPERS